MTEAKNVHKGQIIHKIFEIAQVEKSSSDDDNVRTFTITTDTRDRDKDIVVPAGIIADNFSQNPVMLWAHQYTELPIARSVSMWAQKSFAKDGKTELNTIKAKVVFQPDENYHDSYSGIRGSMVQRMYDTGFLHAVSIGFDPQEWEEIEEKAETKEDLTSLLLGGGGTRFLKWDLLEFSGVPVPANPMALIDRDTDSYKKQLKAWATETINVCDGVNVCPLSKGVIPYSKTPHAPDDATWSGPSEVAAATVDDLKAMCAWYDSANPEVKGSYKLPHHTASGHSLVRAGMVGAGNAIQGARGGVNIPSGDIPGIKSHLEKHYHEFDMKAPWEPKEPKAATPTEEKEVSETEQLKAKIAEVEATLKQGRALSAKNEADIGKANDLSDQIGELLEGVLESTTGKPVAEPEDTGSDVKPAAKPPVKPPAAAPPPKAAESFIDVSYPLGHEVAGKVIPETESDEDVVSIKVDPADVTFSLKEDDEIVIVDTDELEAEIEAAVSEALADANNSPEAGDTEV